jgi:hypothetical protein
VSRLLLDGYRHLIARNTVDRLLERWCGCVNQNHYMATMLLKYSIFLGGGGLLTGNKCVEEGIRRT